MVIGVCAILTNAIRQIASELQFKLIILVLGFFSKEKGFDLVGFLVENFKNTIYYLPLLYMELDN